MANIIMPLPATWLAAAVVSVAGSGCAMVVVSAEGEQYRVGSEPFRTYVEDVFREQNRIATDLGFALVDADLDADEDAYDELEVAEQRLLDACTGLNEFAAVQRDGQRMGRLRALRAARAAPECEAAARDAQVVIDYL